MVCRLVLTGVLVLCSAALAEPVRVEVNRDTWVSEVGREQLGNNGGASRLKAKGVQEFAIVDIDPKPLAGRVITHATLHLNCASLNEPLRRITVSSLASDWVEGTASGYQVQKGSACFLWANTEQTPWAFAGSDITSVCNGLGNTIWRFADATPPDKEGWQTVAVAADVVAARVAGISHGFVVFDDVGSEYTRDGDRFTYKLFLNRFAYSREQSGKKGAFFTVELGAEDRQPPEAVGGISSTCAGLAPGEAVITWATPNDRGPARVIGFLVRVAEGAAFNWDNARPVPQYLVPMAGAPGGKVTMHLRDMGLKGGTRIAIGIRPIDRAGNVAPFTTTPLQLAPILAKIDLKANPAKPFDQIGPRPSLGGVDVAVIDPLDKVHPVTGQIIPQHPASYMRANHLWSAQTKTIRLHAARNEFADFQILLTGKTAALDARIVFDDPAFRAELLRFRHVNTKLGPLPDPLIPVDRPISIPAADENITDQKHATLLADIYIPHNARPGIHTGALKLKSANESLDLRIELQVWDFVLPDQLSFIPEMNCYGLPGQTVEQQEYYRLAHVHRTCLNRLGYSWRGTISDNCAPRIKDDDFDWADYDRRFGPLLDGSAFADLPRKAVPVEVFYLPLNENWPIDVNKAFKGGYWIENAFEPAYRSGFVAACARFAEHIRQKKWNDTFFEFYLNNKVYNKNNSWSRSSAPWIFDEPVNTQDFWALRWYGLAFHEGIAAHRGQTKLAFRCDISRPQWQRDILDGVLDVNIVGGDYRRYHRAVMDRKARNGEIAINYGSSNNIEDSNVQPAAWCLDAWCLGADGVLPWQTVGNEKSWKEADPLSLFYPGGGIGRTGPIPSIRLKSYRRGQQDVEYLTILATATAQPRFAVASAARDVLKRSAKIEQKNADDPGLANYGHVDPAALWELRLRVGATLDAAKPPAQRRQVELRPPARDVSNLPDIGYVSTKSPRIR
ncbi:MAG: DUF4091 domain-containing protein [Planctomycetota bacterium]|nr:DUF4091 domain-containing protein [Planctomycetota bacterium]